MKNYFKLTAILIFSLIIFSFACTNQEALKPVSPNAEVQTYKSKGVIKKVDAENGKLTVDHEDIPGYMSAMEMTEPVKDKAMLETVKVGDKVDFEIERTGSKVVYTKLTKTGEVAVINAAEIYKTNCAECHGEKGEGVEGKGLTFLKGHALDHTEEDFIKRVNNGKGDKMPAFKDKLKPEEIAEVVKFVRNEIQKDAVKDGEKKGHHHH